MLQLFGAVAVGGAVGACSRYGIVLLAAKLFGSGFPVATLLVNVAGSFAMGVLIELSIIRLTIPDELRALLAVGFLGSFTTFSTFSIDAVGLFERGRVMASLAYVTLSVALSIGALVLGLMLVRRWM